MTAAIWAESGNSSADAERREARRPNHMRRPAATRGGSGFGRGLIPFNSQGKTAMLL
jgi:hypothetical protein